MTKDRFTEIEGALSRRSSGGWEARQRLFYTTRNGPHANSKPYPGAPNAHYPLGDGLIDLLKPLYIQQVYGGETIASFVSLKQQDSEMTSAAAYWFDYQLKQRSNFERTMFVAIDQMLESSFTIVKTYWDQDCNRLAFDQVDPMHIIVPSGTQEINQGSGADWLVHVIHLSESEYRANPLFNQDDDYIKTILGQRDSRESGDSAKRQVVELREGISYSSHPNEIVLWEVYDRDRKDKKITVETIAPLRPFDDEEGPVRAPFGLPFNKGVFKNGYTFPFFKIRAELKGKGYYSSRGVMEINLAFEEAISKSWRTLLRWQDFFAQPQFTSSQPIANAANYKTRPGSILPQGLMPVSPPPAPTSLRDDMEFTRAVAEKRTQIPDLGASQHLESGNRTSGKPTATQINAIVGQSGQGNDMRARVFRLDLGEGLNMAWSLCLQYAVGASDETGQPDQGSLTYVVDNEIQMLDANSIHDEYEIIPNGSADSWNKGAEFQKYMALYQTLQQNPYIAQDESTKLLLEKVDPRYVKLLFRDPGIQQQDQMEEQAIEIGTMMLGFPAPVNPSDDDKVHIQCGAGYIERRLSQNEPITPEFARLCLAHFVQSPDPSKQSHFQALVQKKDPMLKQIQAQMAPLVQILGHIAQSDQPGNVIPGPGAQPQITGGVGSPGPSPGPQGKQPAPPDPVADAAKVGNMLAALIKSGVPVTHDEINKVMAQLGLPPLAMSPVGQPQILPGPIAPPQPQPQMQGAM